MSIHEQITAFLDGELTDESMLSELMHVLAVSPEKRGFLVEQARLTRAMTTMAGTIAPSAAADAAILAGLSAVDSRIPPSPPAQSTAAGRGERRNNMLMFGAGAVAIALLGFLSGYLAHDDGSTKSSHDVVTRRAAFPMLSTPLTIGVDIDREVASAIHISKATGEATAPLMKEIARLRLLKDNVRQVIVRQPVYIERQRTTRTPSSIADTTGSNSTAKEGPRLLWNAPPAASVPPARQSSSTLEPRAESIASDGQIVALQDEGDGGMRRWSVGMRNFVRTSLPRIYGLPSQQQLLTDRELTVGLQMDEGWFGLKTPVTFGAAVGNTEFAQSFRRQEGGSSVSSIVEQTPNLWYGRGWVTPQIVTMNGFSGGLELGAGGTVVGPFATIGLSGEYRPIESVSVGLGMSTWLLWSQLETQNVLSANLNGHIGASFWF